MRMKMLSGLLVSISVLAVTACSGGGGSSTLEAKTSAPTPPASLTDTGNLTEADTLTPQDVAHFDEPALLIPATAVVEADAAPSTQEAVLKDRIAKLEETVHSLRRDYDRIMPAFASLNTTNERIQTLLDEIEVQGGVKTPVKTSVKTEVKTDVKAEPMSKPIQPFKAEGAAAPIALAAPTALVPSTTTTSFTTVMTEDNDASGVLPPAGSVSRARADMNVAPAIHTPVTKVVETKIETPVIPAPKVAEAATKDATSSSVPVGAAKGVRIGEHGNKTRLVIDLAGNTKPDVSYDIDNQEKVLLVEMPATTWGGVKTGAAKSSAFVNGWAVQEGSQGGSDLVVQLKKGAKILSTEYLKAQGTDSARLVIDLGPAT